MTITAPKTATKTKELLKPLSSQYGTNPAAEKQEGHQPQSFGIRSYIHQFYDWKSPAVLDEAEGWYLIPPPPHHRRLICLFRAMTVIGLLLLVAGAVGIMVGYMWPREPASVSLKKQQVITDENGDFLISADFISQLMEDHMRPWKLAGLITFAVGGTLLAVSLLIPSCARLCGHTALASEFNTPTEPPVKIFPSVDDVDKSSKKPGSPPQSPTERMVPAFEQLTKVQPSEQKMRRISGDEDAMLVDEN
jgi:hypothetical protein